MLGTAGPGLGDLLVRLCKGLEGGLGGGLDGPPDLLGTLGTLRAGPSSKFLECMLADRRGILLEESTGGSPVVFLDNSVLDCGFRPRQKAKENTGSLDLSFLFFGVSLLGGAIMMIASRCFISRARWCCSMLLLERVVVMFVV